jgi:hypothetical protein
MVNFSRRPSKWSLGPYSLIAVTITGSVIASLVLFAPKGEQLEVKDCCFSQMWWLGMLEGVFIGRSKVLFFSLVLE